MHCKEAEFCMIEPFFWLCCYESSPCMPLASCMFNFYLWLLVMFSLNGDLDFPSNIPLLDTADYFHLYFRTDYMNSDVGYLYAYASQIPFGEWVKHTARFSGIVTWFQDVTFILSLIRWMDHLRGNGNKQLVLPNEFKWGIHTNNVGGNKGNKRSVLGSISDLIFTWSLSLLFSFLGS